MIKKKRGEDIASGWLAWIIIMHRCTHMNWQVSMRCSPRRRESSYSEAATSLAFSEGMKSCVPRLLIMQPWRHNFTILQLFFSTFR